MLTPFLLTQLIFEKPKYIKPIEQDIVVSIQREVIEPIKIELVELQPISYKSPVVQPQNSSNSYEAGQCVWGVKEWRPDIPNGWGSAYQWLYNAQAQDWATGSVARVGAVGVRANHVVLVTAVYGDTIQIREMNYDYVPFHERYRPAQASEFYYIY